MYRHFLGLVIVAILLMAAGSALAETRIWDGGAGNNYWQTASNWDPDGYATSDHLTVDTTVVLASGSSSVVVTGDGSLTIAPGGLLDVTTTSDLRLKNNAVFNLEGTLQRTTGTQWFRLGDDGDLNATVNHSGVLSTTSECHIAFNQYSGSGQVVYNMTGGTFATTKWMGLGWTYATDTGDMVATFNQSGDAVVTVDSSIQMGITNGSNSVGGDGTGYYNMSGGTLDTPSISIGHWSAGGGPSTGEFTQNGGVIGGATRPNVQIGVGAPSTGTYVMRGGTLNARSLTDNGVGVTSTLKIQGGAGTIDVSEAFSFTGVNSTIALEVGTSGLTTIQVSDSGTANVGASTDLTAAVFGGAALNPNNVFTALQIASDSITGNVVDQSGPLWTLSQDSDSIELSLAPGADKGTIAVGSSVSGLNDAYGWMTVLSGGFGPGVFPMELKFTGAGSLDDLAQWMNTAGLHATADSASSMITLADLAIPSGGPSYFFWDLTDYNTEAGTALSVAGITAVPEPSTIVLAMLGLLGLTVRRRKQR